MIKFNTPTIYLIVSGCLFLGSVNSAFAEEAEPKYTPESSSNLYHSNKNAKVLYMQSQMALRGNDLARAIDLGKKAVEMDPEDMDARVVYGDALFRQYSNDKDNTRLYNECVKTWLMVHRNVIGGETGASLKGVGIPLANKFFEDESRGILAKQRLISLCGRLPKFWETNRKYLKKVLVPESKVQGTIVSSTNSDEKDQVIVDALQMKTEVSPIRKKVLACVIERDSCYLVCKRPIHKHHGGLWEFPGGKMEAGESFKETAIRELKEELGLKVSFVGDLLHSIVDDTIDLEICFVSVSVEGEPVLYEHESSSWATVSELKSLSLAPTDKTFACTLS